MFTLLMLIVALLFAPSASPPPEICDGIHALVGGEALDWTGYDNGAWEGWPADVKPTNYINFDGESNKGGVLEYRGKSEPDARFIIVFISYETNADANGEHFGDHYFCGPYRITDGF